MVCKKYDATVERIGQFYYNFSLALSAMGIETSSGFESNQFNVKPVLNSTIKMPLLKSIIRQLHALDRRVDLDSATKQTASASLKRTA
jgi:hypothetical protein